MLSFIVFKVKSGYSVENCAFCFTHYIALLHFCTDLLFQHSSATTICSENLLSYFHGNTHSTCMTGIKCLHLADTPWLIHQVPLQGLNATPCLVERPGYLSRAHRDPLIGKVFAIIPYEAKGNSELKGAVVGIVATGLPY